MKLEPSRLIYRKLSENPNIQIVVIDRRAARNFAWWGQTATGSQHL